MRNACVFCEIVAGTAPATAVEEWPDALAIVPLGPVVDGHVLIIPRQHVVHFAESPDTTAAVMKRAAEYAAGRHDSANLITSMGRAATQSIDHLHVHVVPRTADDQSMVPWGTVYGDDPQAPHWCRVAQSLQDRLDALSPPEDVVAVVKRAIIAQNPAYQTWDGESLIQIAGFIDLADIAEAVQRALRGEADAPA